MLKTNLLILILLSFSLSSQASEKEKNKALTRTEFLDSVWNYLDNNQPLNSSELPLFIQFHADWCASCRIARSILNQLEPNYTGKVEFREINIDHEQKLCKELNITLVPSFLLISKTGEHTLFSGIAETKNETKQKFEAAIQFHLLNNQ
ncbi:MAG: thioredoxin family protein [Mangrovibacterium sp.]